MLPGPRHPRLALFGAGPIGQAFAAQFALLPFQVEAYDGRDAMAAWAVILSDADMVEVADCLEAGDYALIATHSHDLDYQLARTILMAGRVRYCGLIGSRAKRQSFLDRFAADGLSAETIARLNCPAGIAGLHSREPAVIAVAVAAEVLQVATAT